MREDRTDPADLAMLASYENEQSFLGALMLDNTILADVSAFLRPEDFGDALHGRIYEACRRLIDRGEKANILTLKRQFDMDGALKDIGGAKYLVSLYTDTLGPFSAPDSARHIRDLARRRELLAMIARMRGAILDGTVENTADDLIAKAMTEMHRLGNEVLPASRSAAELDREIVAEMEKPTGHRFSTGIPSLDEVMGGGMRPGKTYGVRARSKVGKSVLAVTISDNMNNLGIPNLYLGFEMSPPELRARSLARRVGVNPLMLEAGCSPDILERAERVSAETPAAARYLPMAGRTLDDALREIIGHASRYGTKVVFVDYLGLVSGKRRDESRTEFQDRVAQTIADTCRRLDIACFMLAQCNRDGETRWGDGLNFACDQLYSLHRNDPGIEAALLMEFSRYTAYRSLGAIDEEGNVTEAGLIFHKNGPWFEDAAEAQPRPMRAAE